MGLYVTRRLLLALLTLLAAYTLCFVMIRLAPGDPVEIALGERVGLSEEVMEATRVRLGLDDSIFKQYTSYLSSVATGDLATSFRSGRPVAEEVSHHLPYTLLLTVLALVIAVALGIPAGFIAATTPWRVLDASVTTAAVLSVSAPSFLFAIGLIYVFSYTLGWFPMFGGGATGGLVGILAAVTLPAIALGVRAAASITRMFRASVLDEMQSDYVNVARAKGVRERHVLTRHVLRNAWIPVASIVGLEMAYLMGGSFVIETIFSRPGLGRYMVDSVYARDYVAVQGGAIVIASIVIVINTGVDVVYGLVDPRVRYA